MSHPINLPHFLGNECLHYKFDHLVNPDTQKPWGGKTKCETCKDLADEFYMCQEEMERKIQATDKSQCETCKTGKVISGNKHYMCGPCRFDGRHLKEMKIKDSYSFSLGI